MAVVDDERELASAGGHSDDERASARAAKDQGDAAERDAGFDRTLGDIRGLPETPERSGGAKGGGNRSLSSRVTNMLKKRLAVVAIVGAMAAGVGILGFFALLPLKLISLEENIVHFFDNRTKHAISTRQGAHYRAIFDEHSSHPQGFDQRTGHPLSDYIANFRMDKFEQDLKSSGLGAVHDQNGKLVGFYDLPDVVKGQEAKVVNNAIEVRDKNGKVISRDRLDSYKFHDLSDTSVKERRSFLRSQLANRFPDDGFFRRSIKARNLDARFGIRRRLLATTREKIADKEIDLKRQLADSIRSRVLGSDGAANKNQAAEDEAKQKIKDSSGNTANDLKTLNSLGAIFQVCGAWGVANEIHHSLMLIREAQLMRLAISVLATAHQVKMGDVHPSQLKVLMQQLNGFEKSGGFQRISGDKSKNVNAEKFSLDGGSRIQKAAGVIDDKVGGALPLGAGKVVCRTANGPAGTVVGGAATVVQAVFNVVPGADFADWAVELGGAALKQAASAVIWSEITKEFITVAIKAGSEPIIDATSSAADWVDGTIAGYDNYSSNNARSMGGVKLDAQQVAELNKQANIDEAYDVGRQSLAYKIFNTDYQGSVVNRLALATPSSIQDVSHNFTSTLAAIFPGSINSYMSFISNLLKPLAPAAIAGGGDADPVGAGVTQYGMTDELLNKYPDWKTNEDWVIAHLAAKGQSLMDVGTDSSTELTDQNNDHNDDYHKFVRDCLLSDDKDVVGDQGGQCASDGFTQEERERYTVYRFDLGIGNENNSYNNDSNDQNPGVADSGTVSGSTGSSFDLSKIYDSSVNIPCASGTNDLGLADGYHDGKKIRIRICSVSNLPGDGSDGKAVVNSVISGAVYALAGTAKKANLSLSAFSSFRTMQQQIDTWNSHGQDPNFVAPPGYSNHQMGLAIDYNGTDVKGSQGACATDATSQVWQWLTKNADSFGFKQYCLESWHWSPTGN